MNSGGTIIVSLPSSNFIAPAGSQWAFVYCPNASAACRTTTLPVTGASPNLSSQLSSGLAGPRFAAGPYAFGYLDIEVGTPAFPNTPGAFYWNVTNSITRQWTGVSWQNWVGSGGGGGSPPFNTITSGFNTSASMGVGTGASLVPSGTGQIASTSEYLLNSAQTAPSGIVNTSFCPANTVPFSWQQMSNGSWSTLATIDTNWGTSPLPVPYGVLEFCRNVFVNDNQRQVGIIRNALFSVGHRPGATTGTGSGVQDNAIGFFSAWNSSTPAILEGQVGIYGETHVDNPNYICQVAAAEVCAAGIRSDMVLDAAGSVSGSGQGMIAVSGLSALNNNVASPLGSANLIGVHGFAQNTNNVQNLGGLFFIGVVGGVSANGGESSASGVDFEALSPVTHGFPTQNIAYWIPAGSTWTVAKDWAFRSDQAGLNSETAGYWLFNGATSGQAGIGAAAIAGTPSVLLLPTVDPTSGQFLTFSSVAGGKAQLSWGTPSGSGTLTGITFNAPTGFQVSGSPCASGNCTIGLSMPASWTSGDLLVGNGANSVARLGVINNSFMFSSSSLPSWQATLSTAGDIAYFNGSSLIRLAGNSGAAACLTETGGTPNWGTCGSGAAITVNGGSVLTSPVNFQNGSTVNGVSINASNPSGSNVQFQISGALTNAGLQNSSITVNTISPLAGGNTVALGNSLTLAITGVNGQVLGGAGPAFTAAPVLGINGTGGVTGSLGLANGTTNGQTVTLQNLAAISAYNFNFPATVGTAGFVLTSQAGGTNPTTWTSPTITVSGTACTLGGSCSPSLTTALSGLTQAILANSISNAAFSQLWQWDLTSNQIALQVQEAPGPSTGGTALQQTLFQVNTISGSTAVPVTISNSLTGSQTLPALYLNPTWNTSGQVDAGILMNVTNTSSGNASKLIDLQVGGTSQFSVDKSGNMTAANSFSTTGTGGGINAQEGDCSLLVPAVNYDLLCPNSTLHGWRMNNNNGGYVPVVGGPASSTSGDVPYLSNSVGNALADAGYSYTAVVLNNNTNTGTSAMTLNMSASSSSSSLRVPNIAGASTGTNGTVAYDTTNNNWHIGSNGVDNINVVVPSSVSITNNDCVKWTKVGGVITLNDFGGVCGGGGSPALSAITAAAGSNTIANGNNPQIWNWAQTTNSQSAFTFGETTAATGTGDIELNVQTLASSTAVPLQVTAGGTANGVQVSTTGLLQAIGTGGINATLVNSNTYPASGALTSGGVLCATSTTTVTTSALLGGSIITGGGVGNCPTASNVLISSGPVIRTNTNAGTVTYTGGNGNVSANSALGGAIVQGPSQTGAGGSSSAGGVAGLFGGDNAATNTGSIAGSVGVYAGLSTGASNTGHQGLVEVAGGFAKGTTVTQWNLQCSQSTAENTQDCGASPLNIIGVAENVGTVGVQVVYSGDVPINASAAVTAGDSVCAGTTAGKVTDSGGTGSCTTGDLVGWVTHTSGTYTLPDSTTVTATTTLPIIRFAYAGHVNVSGSVTSISGDGTLISNSGSSGAVTLTLANAGAHKWWGNNTGSSAPPGYQSIGTADLPTIPIAGGGTNATSAATGQVPNTTSSSASSWTATPTLGASGTLGSIAFGNATSGTVTLNTVTGALGSVTASLPANTGTIAEINLAQTWSALQSLGANAAIGSTAHGVLVSENASAAVATAAGTAGQIFKSGGGSDPSFIDFPERYFVPSANCNNTTAGAGWSIGSGGTVTCRAGTNNLGGYISITDTSSTFATFQVTIPNDWDSGTNPYIRFYLASTDATNGHTVIPSIQVACYKGDGTTTDDVAANAAHSSSTVTLNGNANRFWSSSNVQMNSTDMTGCVAGALMQVTVGRATDTATNAEFYGADITFPRLLSVAAQ
jgi:hypothetical protein